MTSTTLNVGNAIGLAVLIAVANRHVGDLSGDAQRQAVTEGMQTAFWIATAGIVLSILVALVSQQKAPDGRV